ncbi:toxin ParE1/3/4 [Paucidesulfovibrio gracilis DSM 16080]|uniref:Toxin n=1 Tax=Paucidesulfovibrio gracilis DSM 16080 TaxID=1121449 RepID=A0A1T4XXX0_9BACT|nr:toxin ParE1/3/4 [Paucidesulfovibrio gracilis DSM 16080]
MRKVRLTPSAKGHLKSVWRYTYETWGEGKADVYLAEIDAKLNQLTDNPNLGRTRPDVKANYHSIKVNKHIVFYLFDDEHIDVIGVLHEKMDVLTRL